MEVNSWPLASCHTFDTIKVFVDRFGVGVGVHVYATDVILFVILNVTVFPDPPLCMILTFSKPLGTSSVIVHEESSSSTNNELLQLSCCVSVMFLYSSHAPPDADFL